MFSLASGIYESYFAYPQLNVLLIGAEGVGKTTLLERLKVTEFTRKSPDAKALASVGITTNRNSSIKTNTNTNNTKINKSNNNNNNNNGTTNSRNSSGHKNKNKNNSKSTTTRRLSCPAPSKYRNAAVADDDDEDSDDDGDDETTNQQQQQHQIDSRLGDPQSDDQTQNKKWLNDKQQSSLEDIDFQQQQQPGVTAVLPKQQQQQFNTSIPEERPGKDETNAHQDQQNKAYPLKQYDLKSGQKMLPLEKIRPTSGQNLAKINNICGAKCHVFDISGKFQDLWQRYYQDCDAVIFCWRLGWNFDHQRDLLENVRKCIPDDVPFLIFGHVHHHNTTTTTNTNDNKNEGAAAAADQENPDGLVVVVDIDEHLPKYSTEQFLPNYHSNVMQVYCGSAKNGKGVRDAIEWLIPLAKRFAKLRLQQAVVR